MKTSDNVLAEFISDLKLEVPGIGVCFNADIEFTTVSFFKIFNCEVHIVTMIQKQLTVLYLLHEQLAEYGIPDTFTLDPSSFSYTRKKSLSITDYDLLRGKYTLIITPLHTKADGKSLSPSKTGEKR